jgi:chromosome segregation ATPase
LTALREKLAAQDCRQEELNQRISHVASVVEAAPGARHPDAEAVAAIRDDLAQQAADQARLADSVEKLAAASEAHRELLDSLHGQLKVLSQQNESAVESRRKLSEAMDLLGRSSDASSQALRKLQEAGSQRDARFESLVRAHNSRSTAMLVAAVILSLLAAAAAAVVAMIHLRGP